jgi:putative restriction endonuclease
MGNVNQAQRAFSGWEILVEQAKKRGWLTYGEIASKINIHPHAVQFLLSPIQDYCLENALPPLTILVNNDKNKKPGAGFIAWSRDNLEVGREEVYQYNWESIKNPFAYAEGGLTEKDLIDELIRKPEASYEIYSKIKVRGMAQIIFKRALLNIYKNKCAFCGFSQSEALEASHIKSWSACDNNEKIDLRNGLLLCGTHHRLFDSKLLFIDEDYIIRVDEKVKAHSEYDRLLISNIEGKKIELPANKNHWPSLSYLDFHKLKV